ncbi:MAG TPA: NADH-quinone oxidoreductase subunit J [Anaerolineaceae bacterium]|nr:NADH-quinone oxidoreductase subunit J [Anaerolineaceae bacterium]
MTSGQILFIFLAAGAVLAAIGLLFSRNAVYAALFLVVNFVSVAILYLVLGAPFIALAQITVYAGAIMVLFLFVIMLLGAEKLQVGEVYPWQRPLAVVLGMLLFGEVLYLAVFRGGLNIPLPAPEAGYGTPNGVGLELFNHYLLPFEVTSVLLLVALVGAVVLTRSGKIRGRS